MNWLPAVAALGAVIWYAIQIWESKTVQKRVRAWKIKHRRRRRHRVVHVAAHKRALPDV